MDDVVIITNTIKYMEFQLNVINQESKKIELKIYRAKTKFMINYETSEKVEIDNIDIEKVEEYKYLGQTIEIEDRTEY